MTALERPIMDAVASGAVIRDLLDTARSSLDDLAEQTALAMKGTWIQQGAVYDKAGASSQFWKGAIGERLAGDPRLSQGIRQSAEGIDLILAEAGRFADDAGDSSLAELVHEARKRVLDGVTPVSVADTLPQRQLDQHLPLTGGPELLQTQLKRHGGYMWSEGTRFDLRWSVDQINSARRAIDQSARLSERLPETAQLRHPADSIAAEALTTLAASRALAPDALLSAQDLAGIARGIDGLAEHVSALGRTLQDDGIIRIVPDTNGTLRIDRAAFDAHVGAIDHTLSQMKAISTGAREMAPQHAVPALDALDATIARLRADASGWTTFVRTAGDESTVDLARGTAPGTLDDDTFRKVLRLHGTKVEHVEGRFRTKDVTRAAVRAPFQETSDAFATHAAAFRTLAGEAAVGSAAEVAGATSVASAHDAIALARERYAAAMAAIDAPA